MINEADIDPARILEIRGTRYVLSADYSEYQLYTGITRNTPNPEAKVRVANESGWTPYEFIDVALKLGWFFHDPDAVVVEKIILVNGEITEFSNMEHAIDDAKKRIAARAGSRISLEHFDVDGGIEITEVEVLRRVEVRRKVEVEVIDIISDSEIE